MAKSTIDFTYPNRETGEPNTPGRPVVGDVNSPVALRISFFENAIKEKYAFVNATYLHAQETDSKEPQPYTHLVNHPQYDSNGLVLTDDAGKTQFTNDFIIDRASLNALVAAASHSQSSEKGRPDMIRRRANEGRTNYTSIYVQAPLELVPDKRQPVTARGKHPNILRPIARRAKPIDRSIVPDDRFWQEVDGKEVLNLSEVDSFQKERSAELSHDRELIRENRGAERVSKLTGKTFGDKRQDYEVESDTPSRVDDGLGAFFAAVEPISGDSPVKDDLSEQLDAAEKKPRTQTRRNSRAKAKEEFTPEI